MLSFPLPAAALAAAIENAIVVEGDTLEISGAPKYDFDAPESGQLLPVERQGLPVWLAGRLG